MADSKLRICIGDLDDFKPKDLNDLSLGVELQDFVNPKLLDGDLESRVRGYQEKLEDFGHEVSVHGPFLDLSPGSPDDMISEVTRKRYMQAVDVALKLNASHLILHSQHNTAIKDPKLKEKKVERQLPFWKEILEMISGKGLVIVLENVTEDDPVHLLNLVESIDSPQLKICYDVGHSLLHSSRDIDSWVEVLKEHIGYVHIHWNLGDIDAHRAPRDEFIKRFYSVLVKNKLDPIVALEYEIDNIKKEVSRVRNCIER
ncbi:MAG: sugar phosphate isomerase/epimerase family protein [Candidatus Saliniplasma sp.]